MPKPYSDDLRWGIIYQWIFYEKSCDKIALQIYVSPNTVYRAIRNFLDTVVVKHVPLGRPTGSITLFPHKEYIIMDCLLRIPQMQLHEIANHIFTATGSAFGPETLCQAVYRLRMMCKKVIIEILSFTFHTHVCFMWHAYVFVHPIISMER